jgi:ribosomal protein S12 methylthiotransferase
MSTIQLISLGCAKNLVDSELMLGQLVAHGYQIVDDTRAADIVLVNTCGFIQPAVEEAIDEILQVAQVKEERPELMLVVTGCMVQRYGAQLKAELPEVDCFLDIDQQPDLIALLEGRLAQPLLSAGSSRITQHHRQPRVLATPFFRAYLKVTEGCDNRCTYCMIPSIRGRLRSRTIDDLVAEAKQLAATGVQELSLIAQDLTAYGNDLGAQQNLTALLRQLLAQTSIPWIRLLYLYPATVSTTLLELMASESRITHYLDIPFQHVSSAVLARMHRRYGLPDLDTLVDRIRNIVPDCVLRTTFLVGFPGETQADFELLLDRLKTWRLNHVGTFVYQDEEGCQAQALPDKVDPELAASRQQELMEAQAEISGQRLAELVAQEVEVLVEGVSQESDLLLEGRWSGQAPDIDGCVYITDGQANPGDIHRVHITEAHTYDLVGEIRRHN